MLRLFVLALLLVLAIIEYKKPMKPFVFYTVYGLMTLMLALRCGQGTDYFSYCQIYTEPEVAEQTYEPGYMLINSVFKPFNIPYTVFIFIYSVVLMLILFYIIKKFCPNKFMGLFIMFSLYYLQFFESSIRQALAMMIILACYCLTASKGKIRYLLIGTALSITIHYSAVISILFLIPYFLIRCSKSRDFIERRRKLCIIIGMAICVLLLAFSLSPALHILAKILPSAISVRVNNYLANNTYSIMALLSRVAFLVPVTALYMGARKKASESDRILFMAYLFGFVIYCGLFRFDIISSRMNAYYKIIEIVLIPRLISNFSFETNKLKLNGKIKCAVKPAIIAVTSLLLIFMYLKTTSDVMGQSLYYDRGYIYPYTSVFNVQDLYGKREAPGFTHKEFYQLMDKPNPRYVGVGTPSLRYFGPASIEPSGTLLDDYYETLTSHTTWDPMTTENNVVALLNETYSGEIYDESFKIVLPRTEAEKDILPIRIKDILQKRG